MSSKQQYKDALKIQKQINKGLLDEIKEKDALIKFQASRIMSLNRLIHVKPSNKLERIGLQFKTWLGL